MRTAWLVTVALGTAAATWGCGSAPMDDNSDPGAAGETRAVGQEENAPTTEEALGNQSAEDTMKGNEGDEDLGQTKSPLWGGGWGGWGGGWRGGFGGAGWWGGGWSGGWWGGGWARPGWAWGGGWWGGW